MSAMTRYLCLFALLSCLAAAGHEPPASPLATTAIAQKNLALRLFASNANVKSALKTLHDSNYKLLSTDAVPTGFAFSDEGPHATFLVTAWLGKAAAYGWTAAFVSAKVNTDSFGPQSVTLLDPKRIQSALP